MIGSPSTHTLVVEDINAPPKRRRRLEKKLFIEPRLEEEVEGPGLVILTAILPQKQLQHPNLPGPMRILSCISFLARAIRMVRLPRLQLLGDVLAPSPNIS